MDPGVSVQKKTSQETQRSLEKFLEPDRKPKVMNWSDVKRVDGCHVDSEKGLCGSTVKKDDGERVKVDVSVDTDWVSGRSRKSTGGGMLTHWSRTRKSESTEFWRGRVVRDGDGVC